MASKDKEIVIRDSMMTPERLRAINTIRSQVIPKESIRTRKGKGGKVLSYVKHTWVTQLLQDAFVTSWSWEVLKWEVFHEKLKINDVMVDHRSILTLGKLTLRYPINPQMVPEDYSGPLWYDQVFQEVGTFEPMPSMPSAAAVASCASRNLARCTMRALGIGMQFYTDDDDPITPNGAWTQLRTWINKKKGWDAKIEEEIIALFKNAGISKDNILDRYTDAWAIVNEYLGLTEIEEEMPV